LVLEGLDRDADEDVIPHSGQKLGHAELGALDAGGEVGAAHLLLVDGVHAAVEVVDGELDRLFHTQERQRAVHLGRLAHLEHEHVGLTLLANRAGVQFKGGGLGIRPVSLR